MGSSSAGVKDDPVDSLVLLKRKHLLLSVHSQHL